MKNKTAGQPSEAPTPSTPEADPLAAQKRAFEEALAKTKAEEGDAPEPDPVVEPVPRKKPKAEKAKPAPEPVEDPMQRRLADLERRLEEAQRAPQKPAEPAVDPLKAMQERLAEKFGEDEGATLAETFGDYLRPLLERTALMEKMLVDATERGRKQTAVANHKRLSKEHAQLKGNDAALGMIDMQVEALVSKNPSKFSSLDEAYDHVVEALYGGQEEAEEEADEGEGDADAIAASAPTIPNHKTSERKLTNEQKSRQIFDHLFKNPDDAAGAAKLARQLKIG